MEAEKVPPWAPGGEKLTRGRRGVLADVHRGEHEHDEVDVVGDSGVVNSEAEAGVCDMLQPFLGGGLEARDVGADNRGTLVVVVFNGIVFLLVLLYLAQVADKRVKGTKGLHFDNGEPTTAAIEWNAQRQDFSWVAESH